MSSPKLPLQSFRLKNFKAIRDSGIIRFTPLTVLIGNNGSGKSSLIEGLEMFKEIGIHGIDESLQPWRGFEHVWNKAITHKPKKNREGKLQAANPLTFSFKGRATPLIEETTTIELSLGMDPEENKVYIHNYHVLSSNYMPHGRIISNFKAESQLTTDQRLSLMVGSWKFINLSPQEMLYPRPQKRTLGGVGLIKNGANVAEYLQNIRDSNLGIFNDIVETLRHVLPCVDDLQPAITSELERNVYLSLTEKGIDEKIPGWLLSQGTLRILALLGLFRHPRPPSVIIIEEIENGLDPRTIHMVVDEIRSFVQSGKGQVIATTHSPYLLDLLSLSQIIVVERDEQGSPIFTRPADNKELAEWVEKFAPGKLYTMGNLTRR